MTLLFAAVRESGGGSAAQKMALVLWRTPDGKRELSIVRKPSPPPGGMKSNGPMAAAGALFVRAGTTVAIDRAYGTPHCRAAPGCALWVNWVIASRSWAATTS